MEYPDEDHLSGLMTTYQTRNAKPRTKQGRFCRKQIPRCPIGWLKDRTSCYLLNMTNMKWPEAKASCHSQGAYMSSIGDEHEKDLAANLQAERTISYLLICGSWDGAALHWDSGEGFDYTAWRNSEPGGHPFMTSTTSGWRDVKSFNSFPSLFEK
ncbi:ladderlectin-like [Mya arenaria]|uniref:ladderlectin-like n=1 Tax=Mya arenaria TaxID=6604 RepID=UPI0022E96E98|nr:ladderlectin-like [Mya arenaria]